MEKREFLKGAAGLAGLSSLAGCSDFLEDDRPGRNEDNGGYKPGDPEDPVEDDSEYTFARQIQFIDNTGALGHVAEVKPDTDTPEEYENNRTEQEWNQWRENDLENATEQLDEIDRRDDISSINDMRPFIEQALDESPEDEPNERVIIETVGYYSNHEVALPRLSEHFAQEYLEDSNLRMWMVRVTNPETHGSFSVHNFAASYEHQGDTVNDWVDIGHIPSAQRVENPENQDLVPGGVDVRDPWDTIYAQNEELEWLGAYQFEKMVTAANEGMVEQDEAFNPGHPMHSISNNILYYTTKMVDPADDDYEIESIPPNGLITAITPEFGNSLESAFYDNWDDKKRQMMENIGRATSRFFEVEGSGGYLGVDGTLEQPEFYIIAEKEDVKEIWDRSLEGEDFDLDEY